MSVESEAITIYLDQFSPAERSELTAVVFNHGAVIQGRGDRAEPVEDTGPPAQQPEPLTDAEQDVLDFLKRHSIGKGEKIIPYKGREIADGAQGNRSYNTIKSALVPNAALRKRGLIKHRSMVGYWAVPEQAPALRPAEIAIAQTLAEQPDGERLSGSTLAAKSGYASIRKFLGPCKPLATFWGVKNDRGYYLSADDRERIRVAFPT